MNPAQYNNAWGVVPDRIIEALRNKSKEKAINEALTPVGNKKARHTRRVELDARRERQKEGARIFMATGDTNGNGTPPSYGDSWNRFYDASPDLHSRPSDHDMRRLYEGAGIPFLYKPGYDRFAWQTAGWNIGHKLSEVSPNRLTGGTKR